MARWMGAAWFLKFIIKIALDSKFQGTEKEVFFQEVGASQNSTYVILKLLPNKNL